MATDIAIVEEQQDLTPQRAPLSPRKLERFEPRDFGELRAFAEFVIQSKLCGVNNVEDAVVIMMTGAEMGLTVMQSLRGVSVIGTSPSVRADTMAAVVMASSACQYLRVARMDAQVCEIETLRRGHPEPVRMAWTIEDAKRAGLERNPSYRKFPSAMLKARCMAQICRAVYPDVIAGVYETSELEHNMEVGTGSGSARYAANTNTDNDVLDVVFEEQETWEDKARVATCQAAVALAGLVDELLGTEDGKRWRAIYCEKMQVVELTDVPESKLCAMGSKIRSVGDGEAQRAYLLGHLGRQPERDVAAPGRALQEQAAQRAAERAQARKMEAVAFLQEMIEQADRLTDGVGDRWRVVLYEQHGVDSLQDLPNDTITRLQRIIAGLGLSQRADWMAEQVEDWQLEQAAALAPSPSETILPASADAEDTGPVSHKSDERWQAANKSWWAVLQSPWVEASRRIEDEDEAKRVRREGSAFSERYTKAMKAWWGVESAGELSPERYHGQVAKLQVIAEEQGVEALGEYLREQLAKVEVALEERDGEDAGE